MDVHGRDAFSTVPCEKCQTLLTVPVMLGTFLLLERMGAGGMGAVYRGLDTSLNRFVAIKVMKPSLGEDKKLVDSFIREARAAAALNHRNIVQIYSCGQERGQPYIVMELVTGGKMNQMFSRENPMDEVALLKISLDVAEGLKAANEAGLVHGDIKPENVLIDGNGTGKIVDFGLAQFVNAQKEKGEIWGTPFYISPERARGNKADHRSDIYSLGATMFHALAGTPPFDGPTPVDVVLARLKNPPPDLKSLMPDIQGQTNELIKRMMVADPSFRYPNSASLMSDMKGALDAAKAAKKERTQAPAPKKNVPSMLIGVAALLVMAVLGGLFLSGVLKTKEQGPAPSAKKNETPAAKSETGILLTKNVTGADGVTRPVITLNVFDDGPAARLADAARQAAAGRYAESIKVYEAEARALQDRLNYKPAFAWIRLMQAIPSWLRGDPMGAREYLNQVAILKVAQPLDPTDPGRMPLDLAGYLLGSVPAEQIARHESVWPSWFSALRNYMKALPLIADEKYAEARPYVEHFLARADEDPAWVYGYRAHAEEWLSQYHAAEDAARDVQQRLLAGRLDDARSLLNLLQEQSSPLVQWKLKPVRKQLDQAAPAPSPTEVPDQAAAREQRRAIQDDLDRIDNAMTNLAAMILKDNDYRRAALSLSTLASDMKTPEGRRSVELVQRRIEKMDGIKSFIIMASGIQPFTRKDGCDLGGDLVAATPLGARVTPDGRAVNTLTWSSIAMRSLVRVTDFYAGSDRIPASDRAQGLISLAVLSLMNGAVEPARQYAQRALDLDATVTADVRSLLPGLIP